MSNELRSLYDNIRDRLSTEFLTETTQDTDELFGVPNPYTVSGKDGKNALFYWDTYFINMALIKLGMPEQARNNVDNLIFLARHLGHIPASNKKKAQNYSQPPLLPWMVRDIYRATGDKEWVRRVLPEVEKEFNLWTKKPHSSPNGLFRYASLNNDETLTQSESGWCCSPRFDAALSTNPVDLNALLYRNGKIIFDLQKEVHGEGVQAFLQKSDQIKKLMDICWDDKAKFFFDNDFEQKKLNTTKTLAGFMPIFVEMVNKDKAGQIHKNLADFVVPGGLTSIIKNDSDKVSAWNYPLSCAPVIYFTVKGLYDYEYLEDAVEIASAWTNMVFEIYQKTGEMWEWYDAKAKSHKHKSLSNTAIMGWTVGTYIELVETFGLP